MIQYQGAHSDIGGLADSASSRYIGPGKDAHVITYLGMMSDQSAPINENVAAQTSMRGNDDPGTYDAPFTY